MSITRRTFVSSTAATVGFRVLAPATVASTLLPIPAQANPAVLAAISAASAVAGMIAANNKRDGSAMIVAMNEKLDVIIGQIASLQEAVSMVLSRLAALPERIDSLLQENEARNARLAIRAALNRYVDQIQSARRSYSSLVGFRADELVMWDLQAVLNSLYGAMGDLKAQNAFDPYTALLLPSAIALEYSLLTLRGDQRHVIAARMEQNLTWFDNVANPAIAKSTAAYRQAAVERLNDLNGRALGTPLGSAFGMKPGTVLFDCVGVNDYTPERPERLIRMGGVEYEYTMPGSPARHGSMERMVSTVTLEEKPVLVPAKDVGGTEDVLADFTQPVLSAPPFSSVMQASDPRLANLACRVQTIDQRDGNARAAIMRDMLTRTPRATEQQAFKSLLEEITIERARISFATASLAVMEDFRPKLLSIIDGLKV
ncbi:hypothetical protein [Methylobacterium radiotolerans]